MGKKFDIWSKPPAPRPTPKHSLFNGGYYQQILILAVGLGALWFALSMRDRVNPDDPDDPDPPAPTGEVTHVLAIDGSPAVVGSTKVNKFCVEAGIEYRALASGNRPSEAEKEILKLYDEGLDKAPRVLFLYKNGRITDSPMPASADELVVYIEGASS